MHSALFLAAACGACGARCSFSSSFACAGVLYEVVVNFFADAGGGSSYSPPRSYRDALHLPSFLFL